jgi:uncharacterized protein (UPF0332 family)
MMFDWDKYLNLAQTISKQQPPTEAECRTSVSRAYYAVFNKCSDTFFSQTQTVKPREDSHRFIIEKFKSGKKEAKTIGFHLETLKVSRVESDYNSSKVIDKSKMDSAIKIANIINQKLSAITAEHF